MTIITKEMLLSRVVARFKEQYHISRVFRDGTKSDDKIKLLESETDLTEERVAEIIGNTSWTRNECVECEKDVFLLVKFNREVKICPDCLRKAVVLTESKT